MDEMCVQFGEARVCHQGDQEIALQWDTNKQINKHTYYTRRRYSVSMSGGLKHASTWVQRGPQAPAWALLANAVQGVAWSRTRELQQSLQAYSLSPPLPKNTRAPRQ